MCSRRHWTTIRGVEAMDNSYRLLDLTVYGRQEKWEHSPTGWPQGEIMETLRTNGRPTAQWSRLKAGLFGRPGHGQALNRARRVLRLQSRVINFGSYTVTCANSLGRLALIFTTARRPLLTRD